MGYLPRVLHYLRPYWKLAIASSAILFAAAAGSLLAPWPLKILIDSVLGNVPVPPVLAWFAPDRYSLSLFVVLAGLSLSVGQNLLGVFENYVNTKLHLGMALDFRGDLFQHAQRLSLAFHDQRRSGMLIYAVNYQADAAAQLVVTVSPLAQSALTLLGMFWITFQIDAQLALLSLVIVPVLYYSVTHYIEHIQSRIFEVKGMEADTLSIIHEAFSMLRVIVAFGREGYEFRRFRRQGERAVDARVNLTVRQTLFSLIVNSTIGIGHALVLGFGAYFALPGRLTGGLPHWVS